MATSRSTISSADLNARTEKTGFLRHRYSSLGFHRWRQCYMLFTVTNSGRLEFITYKQTPANPADKLKHVIIESDEYRSVETNLRLKSERYTFAIITNSSTECFSVDTPQEMTEWTKVIQKHMDKELVIDINIPFKQRELKKGKAQLRIHNLGFTITTCDNPPRVQDSWKMTHISKYGGTDSFRFQTGSQCPTGAFLYTIQTENNKRVKVLFTELANQRPYGRIDGAQAVQYPSTSRMDIYADNIFPPEPPPRVQDETFTPAPSKSEKDLAEKLWHASNDNLDSEVVKLLQQGAPPNYSQLLYGTRGGRTPLHNACRHNNHHMARMLLKWGANVDTTDNFGQSPLHTACDSKTSHFNCVQILMEENCQTGIKNGDGETALDLAERFGHKDIVECITNFQSPSKGPLSKYPSIEKLKWLIVSEPTFHKWYRLGLSLGVPSTQMEVIKNGRKPALATLLAAKTKNIDMTWKEVVEGLVDVQEYILAEKVCSHEVKRDHTPLSACVYYGWVDLLTVIMDKKHYRSPINKAGDTVLSLACTIGHIEIISHVLTTKGLNHNGAKNAAGDTLRSLAESHGQKEVTKYLDMLDLLSGPGDRKEKLKYLKKLEELISDTKHTTLLQYIKMYFIGPSGLGKTTTRKRLTGAIVNISSLPPEKQERCSTHLAECTQVLAIADNAGSNLTLKASDNLDEEAQLLFAYLYGRRNEEGAEDTTSTCGDYPPENQEQSPERKDTKTSTTGTDIALLPDVPEQSPDRVQRTLTEAEENLASPVPEQARIQPSLVPAAQTKPPVVPNVRVDVLQVITRLRSIVGSGKYAEQLLGRILLNLIDVGGQPGFLEMLPFLSKGPGMFLTFFPLDKDLDKQCEVSYEREGNRITPYKATYTIREALSQILSAISHHTSFDSQTKLFPGLVGLGSIEPVATLVGTFKDKLEVQVKAKLLEEEISREFPNATKNSVLKMINRSLDTHQFLDESADVSTLDVSVESDVERAIDQHLSSEPFQKRLKDRLDHALKKKSETLGNIALNFSDLLSLPSDDQHFIAVDNYNGTDSDIDPLRKHLQVIFESFFKDAKVPIRPSQLLLGVVLRKEYNIVSMEDCIEIGRALNMGEEDVRFTVWFLDYFVGALIYHPEIEDDWFKNHIISSPQVIFDSTSALIIESLMELHSEKGSSRPSRFKQAERKNWTEKGQFSLDSVRRCHSAENEKSVQEGKLIPVDKLVKLLEHSNLLATITVTRKNGKKERVCFVPAILQCATPEELTKSPPPDCDTPSPVKITFKSGYVPLGVFCATISRLVSRGSDGILGMKWELVDSCVKRNMASFRVDSAEHIVTLLAHIECLEIRVIRQNRSLSLQSLCFYVLSTVLYVIKMINSRANPIISFSCECSLHHPDDSAPLCLLSTGVTPCLKCKHGEVSLTTHQEPWLVKRVVPFATVCVKAFPFAKKQDLQGVSFEWSKNGTEEASSNELKIGKVAPEQNNSFYICEIFNNGECLFNVPCCIKLQDADTLSEGVTSSDQFLGKIKEAIKAIRADWYSLAVELSIDHATRKDIEKSYRFSEVCFHVMLQHWVSRTSPAPSYSALIMALKSPAMNYIQIAQKLVVMAGELGSDNNTSFQSPISSQDTLGVDSHLKIVREATWGLRAKWYILGVMLGVEEGTLQAIQHNHQDVAGPCFTALLEEWLSHVSPPPTWDALLDAIQSHPIGHRDIASQIEQRFL